MNKKYEFDKLSIKLDVRHDPLALSSGSMICSDDTHSFDKSTLNYKEKKLTSEYGSVIRVKSYHSETYRCNDLKISGNFYKWLNGENILGCDNLIELVLQVVYKMQELKLVTPTKRQIEKIKRGEFQIYDVDIKYDVKFKSKQNSLQYLSHLIHTAKYPYKSKAIYENGIYFGLKSDRWQICCYHKGCELDAKKHQSKHSTDLQQLADLTIRKEIRVKSKQLHDWNFVWGHQWIDVDYTTEFFRKKFDNLFVPELIVFDSKNEITNKSDRKFYNTLMAGDVENVYSRSTINRKHKDFLIKYNIDIKNFNVNDSKIICENNNNTKNYNGESYE